MAVVSSDKGQKLVLKQFAKQPGLQSDDATYWKAFKVRFGGCREAYDAVAHHHRILAGSLVRLVRSRRSSRP